jgi:hypothetical protein
MFVRPSFEYSWAMKLPTFGFVGLFFAFVVGVILGAALAYHFPEGWPGAEGPPADQKLTNIVVKAGILDFSDDWVRKVDIYLVPLAGILGDRSYSALIFVPIQGGNIHAQNHETLYLQAKGFDLIQPVGIDADDFTEMAANHVVVKLLDDGPNSGQPYSNVKNLTLDSQPDYKLPPPSNTPK